MVIITEVMVKAIVAFSTYNVGVIETLLKNEAVDENACVYLKLNFRVEAMV